MQHWWGVALLLPLFAQSVANAGTVTVNSNFNNFVLGCVDVTCCSAAPCDPDFSVSFMDTVPAGATVSQIRVISEGAGFGAPMEVITLNGTAVGTTTVMTVCDCANIPVCGAHTVESPIYSAGFPGYVYGGLNQLDIEAVSTACDSLCTDNIVIEIEYFVCNNAIPEVGEACDDGNADWCDGCTPDCTASPTCSDGNVCTDDVCNPGTGACSNPSNTAGCDDADLCTTNDTCSGGVCMPGVPVDCDDGDLCTVDACDPGNGSCTNTPLDCDDQDICTTDSCSMGVCSNISVGGGCCTDDLQCDDGDPCTMDQCVANVCMSLGECSDAGVPPDAAPPDSGPLPDAGFIMDATVEDLGTEADAGTVDVGTEEPDAGHDPADAAFFGPERDESGTRLNDGRGCGCDQVRHQGVRRSPLLLLTMLIAMWLIRRRRRPVGCWWASL